MLLFLDQSGFSHLLMLAKGAVRLRWLAPESDQRTLFDMHRAWAVRRWLAKTRRHAKLLPASLDSKQTDLVLENWPERLAGFLSFYSFSSSHPFFHLSPQCFRHFPQRGGRKLASDEAITAFDEELPSDIKLQYEKRANDENAESKILLYGFEDKFCSQKAKQTKKAEFVRRLDDQQSPAKC